MTAKNIEIVTASGTEIFIPLNKLKKSPNNARKTPHSEASIEAYAASIAAKGILQNLVVEPELDGDGTATGFYFVTIGEGRRLAQLLRVKRKEIKKTEPIRCVIDTANDAFEISFSICHSSVRPGAAPFLRSLIAVYHASPFFLFFSNSQHGSSYRRSHGGPTFVCGSEVKPEAARGGGAQRQA
ncbi:ParB-like nuclease domain-containing protein [Tardiphaga sp. OK246]|jgi:hypothetical protein|nr:ParB-like nuclease domain-containing protein [Tardiphaga sp. OK246]